MDTREAVIEELKLAPESLVREAYDFVLFLKTREREPSSLPGKRGSAGAWARMARGSARLEPGESRDDARMAYYREKYGVS